MHPLFHKRYSLRQQNHRKKHTRDFEICVETRQSVIAILTISLDSEPSLHGMYKQRCGYDGGMGVGEMAGQGVWKKGGGVGTAQKHELRRH